MDLFEEIKGITQAHNTMMRAGLKSGQEIGERVALGKVVDELTRLLQLQGLSGDWHRGYRKALSDVRGFILTELQGKS